MNISKLLLLNTLRYHWFGQVRMLDQNYLQEINYIDTENKVKAHAIGNLYIIYPVIHEDLKTISHSAQKGF